MGTKQLSLLLQVFADRIFTKLGFRESCFSDAWHVVQRACNDCGLVFT